MVIFSGARFAPCGGRSFPHAPSIDIDHQGKVGMKSNFISSIYWMAMFLIPFCLLLP
jgi:hypothetical protein